MSFVLADLVGDLRDLGIRTSVEGLFDEEGAVQSYLDSLEGITDEVTIAMAFSIPSDVRHSATEKRTTSSLPFKVENLPPYTQNRLPPKEGLPTEHQILRGAHVNSIFHAHALRAFIEERSTLRAKTLVLYYDRGTSPRKSQAFEQSVRRLLTVDSSIEESTDGRDGDIRLVPYTEIIQHCHSDDYLVSFSYDVLRWRSPMHSGEGETVWDIMETTLDESLPPFLHQSVFSLETPVLFGLAADLVGFPNHSPREHVRLPHFVLAGPDKKPWYEYLKNPTASSTELAGWSGPHPHIIYTSMPYPEALFTEGASAARTEFQKALAFFPNLRVVRPKLQSQVKAKLDVEAHEVWSGFHAVMTGWIKTWIGHHPSIDLEVWPGQQPINRSHSQEEALKRYTDHAVAVWFEFMRAVYEGARASYDQIRVYRPGDPAFADLNAGVVPYILRILAESEDGMKTSEVKAMLTEQFGDDASRSSEHISRLLSKKLKQKHDLVYKTHDQKYHLKPKRVDFVMG